MNGAGRLIFHRAVLLGPIASDGTQQQATRKSHGTANNSTNDRAGCHVPELETMIVGVDACTGYLPHFFAVQLAHCFELRVIPYREAEASRCGGAAGMSDVSFLRSSVVSVSDATPGAVWGRTLALWMRDRVPFVAPHYPLGKTSGKLRG